MRLCDRRTPAVSLAPAATRCPASRYAARRHGHFNMFDSVGVPMRRPDNEEHDPMSRGRNGAGDWIMMESNEPRFIAGRHGPPSISPGRSETGKGRRAPASAQRVIVSVPAVLPSVPARSGYPQRRVPSPSPPGNTSDSKPIVNRCKRCHCWGHLAPLTEAESSSTGQVRAGVPTAAPLATPPPFISYLFWSSSMLL